MVEPDSVAFEERPVEVVLVPERAHELRRRRPRPEQELHRVARREIEQRERSERDDEQDRDEADEAAEGERRDDARTAEMRRVAPEGYFQVSNLQRRRTGGQDLSAREGVCLVETAEPEVTWFEPARWGASSSLPARSPGTRLRLEVRSSPRCISASSSSERASAASSSRRCCRRASATVEVTLIDKSDAFVFGYSKLDVMFGRTTLDAVRLPVPRDRQAGRAHPARDDHRDRPRGAARDDRRRRARGRRARRRARRRLRLGRHARARRGRQRVLLGRRRRAAGASVLPTFSSGRAIIGVCGAPFKCPPAPSECALLLHDYLTARGVRDACEISLVIPFGTPVPPSPDTSAALLDGVRRARHRVRRRPPRRVARRRRAASPCSTTAASCRSTSSSACRSTARPTS